MLSNNIGGNTRFFDPTQMNSRTCLGADHDTVRQTTAELLTLTRTRKLLLERARLCQHGIVARRAHLQRTLAAHDVDRVAVANSGVVTLSEARARPPKKRAPSGEQVLQVLRHCRPTLQSASSACWQREAMQRPAAPKQSHDPRCASDSTKTRAYRPTLLARSTQRSTPHSCCQTTIAIHSDHRSPLHRSQTPHDHALWHSTMTAVRFVRVDHMIQ